MNDKWKFWIDRGGTFTDVVACDPEGTLRTHKLLSESPEQYPDAAIAGIRHILSLNQSEPIPAKLIDSVRMGTTVATNALLERKGTPTVLVITEGFGDALRIGSQNRPDIFALDIKLPESLYDYVVEIPERISASGDIEKKLDSAASLERLQKAFAVGYRSCAVILMHGYHNPLNELAVAKLAEQCGFEQISLSSTCSPLPRLVSRGDTTVADAYLSPVLSRYVNQVQNELGDIPLLFMQSTGGLCHANAFDGKDAVLSGPAGGVVGGIETARLAGFDKLIGFDMGGTSTDVWHYAGKDTGDYEHQSEHIVAGIRLRTPMMRIHTVAAGGGSILHYSDGRFQVGPDSAAANPGPASYRRGGPLCVTDCNVLLGKIQPEHFPSVFGEKGNLPLDDQTVSEKFTEFSSVTGFAEKENQQLLTAEGFLTIAIENMTQAIRKISVQRGYDVSRYTLCVFGGAGGQHACLVADALGMKTIYCHPMAGVLSAYGIGLAAISTVHEVAIGQTLTADSAVDLHTHLQQLSDTGLKDLKQQGEGHAGTETLARLFLRYPGSDTTLELPFTTELNQLTENFIAAHRQQFGYSDPSSPIIVESLRVTVSTKVEMPVTPFSQHTENSSEARQTEFFSGGQMHRASILKRTGMPVGHTVKGPAIITEDTGTLIIEPGWQAEVMQDMAIVLSRIVKHKIIHDPDSSNTVDPVLLEIFNRRFMAIAEQMGLVLERTSHSVNIKERMDFSCALFTPYGDLIANAPHIPVHLGSMSDSVRAVIEKYSSDVHNGDSFLLNNPYQGGTHLPDITVITPVFDQHKKEILFFVASRGHHADIGGITPGSMPATSSNIDEEGILLDNIRFVQNHRLDEKLLNDLLIQNRYPARKPEQNIADLRAQLAANHQGIKELYNMLDEFGLNVVSNYMNHVLNNAETTVKELLGTLDDGQFSCVMDNGAEINVSITIDHKEQSAVIDFSGTSKQLTSNFNAPASVCHAAVLYVFRCLVNKDIPLNEGCLRPLTLRIPEHSIINPDPPAAVVAGNVETSQIIVDCLLAALGKLAASQGTMNNFTFGNEKFQYYETICGGTGAGPSHHGTSAVQSHMTNSRLTDPEILEQRFPVQLEYFRIRKNSGGGGKFIGGEGVERCLRFLQPVRVSILANRRQTEPFGLAGGMHGECGENWYIDLDGEKQVLPACVEIDVPAGGSILIRTPGGGGYGTEGS